MTGRNDPCPCGSGKKYKKCCLKQDEAARRAEAARSADEAAAAPPAPWPAAPNGTQPPDLWADETDEAWWDEPEAPAEVSAEADALYARWEEFEAAEDYEEQIALFLRTLDDGLLDAETAFEMLNVIHGTTAAHDERDRFDALVAQLRQRLPEVYAHDAHFYADWLISNALAAGRLAALPALVEELADTAGAELDTVNRVFDQLAYHGQLALLAAAMRRAWPLVRDAGQYFEWAVDEFAERGMTIALLDYLERTAAPNPVELAALGAEFDVTLVQPGGAAQFLAHITGQADRRWTLADFDLTVHRRRKGEPEPPADTGRTNLYYLTVEFLGYLRRVEGLSYARGELARDQIQRYILERHDGQLQNDDDRRRTGKRGAKTRLTAPGQPLCPERGTLDRYLVSLLNIFSSQPHRAAALFETLPAWLRFLAERGLLDADLHERTLHELHGLVDSVCQVLGSYLSDPGLRLTAERWEAAFAIVPWEASIEGTLGAALVETGAIEEGLHHLVAAGTHYDRPRSQAANLAWRALAQHRLGQVEQAQALLEEATRLDGTHPGLQLIAQKMKDSSPNETPHEP